jgi:hypothetical protein
LTSPMGKSMSVEQEWLAHPLSGVELRAMRRLKRDQDPPSPFVFTSERVAPSRRRGGARWWRGWAPRLGLGFTAHPHCCGTPGGFQLANQDTDRRTLQAYLGQSPARFWTDAQRWTANENCGTGSMRTRSSESGDRTLNPAPCGTHRRERMCRSSKSSGVASARLVTSSVGDLPILVLFRRQDYVCECRVRAHWGACVLSVLQFIPMDVFDGATVCNVGRAFGLACKKLNDAGQPDVVHEVMIKRNIAAARRGECDAKRLRDAGLTGLRSSVKVIPTGGATSPNRV